MKQLTTNVLTYNRAISVARTSYSVLSMNRGYLPDTIGEWRLLCEL